MKTTKTLKWIAAVMMIIGFASSSYAQAAQAAANEAKQLQVSLKLSDAQTTKLTGILQQIGQEEANDKAGQAQMRNWQAAHNTRAMIDYILKQMDTNAARIAKVLTPEQDRTFQAMVKKRHDALLKMEAAQK